MTPHESVDALFAELLLERRRLDLMAAEVKTLSGLIDTVLEDNDALTTELRQKTRLIGALERSIVLLHDVIAAKDRHLESLVRA